MLEFCYENLYYKISTYRLNSKFMATIDNHVSTTVGFNVIHKCTKLIWVLDFHVLQLADTVYCAHLYSLTIWSIKCQKCVKYDHPKFPNCNVTFLQRL